MSLRIVQITDTHLSRDPDGVLAGVATWKTFNAVLRQIERRHADFDYLVLTGDLAQDEALETYQMLREALGEWLHRLRIIPGNHDAPANLRAVFPELFPRAEGPLTFTLSNAEWKIIGLDSHLPGDVKGRIDAGQLEWLRGELCAAPDLPSLLFVHHPPVAINVAWIDKLGLHDPDDLIGIIEGSPQIKAVCAGHVHQEFCGQIGAAAVFTTPSTCVQFSARAEKAFDTRAAGYRTFRLEESCQTEVHRLSDS
ncbi:MAG: phosphodiesterase [Gammaproteobacteria bacterium]|nr:phosphodiesterase [Gammaproteobacteria bacterium]NIM74608.1 phosphodiesterase [Gammaproteobacteria bacterium]NIO26441.1 phosphodiesterase [Gammaproteobacteria bacterium]NIO66993.1 phosphodiesterase [Gammaproteobacteria bacterium]NIP46808.1 phosphodiesterase [Gammaproteobacteria bacterium]